MTFGLKFVDESINIEDLVKNIGAKAKMAAGKLSCADSEVKNKALKFAANEIRKNASHIVSENKKDLETATAKGQTKAFIDRLMLDEARVVAIANAVEEVANLPDPVGKILEAWERPNGLKISRVATPLGVIGIIFESRPNVTADASALCIKSGNAAILRCGSESINSSFAIAECIKAGLKEAGIDENAITLIPVADREAVTQMLQANEYIDVIVPRGGKGLVQKVINESKIPLFQHLDGNCHTYIHEKADVAKAVKVAVNAKMRRTGICGATETIVVDSNIANEVLPKLADGLAEENCEIRGCEKTCAIISSAKQATDEDWDTEFLDAIVSIKVVDGLDEGLEFVKAHSSSHTDAIITEDGAAAERFFKEIDSAIVMHNTSTQFADGGEFGFGGEIGIATGKMHARGPVGPAQLCTFKYIVQSEGMARG